MVFKQFRSSIPLPNCSTMSRILLSAVIFGVLGLSYAHFKPVKLFNWSYKDLGTTAFSDVSLAPRQRYSDFPIGKCPDGWVQFSDSCYWIENEKFGFAEAEQHCYEKNATLVVINSQDEFDVVRNHSPQSFSWMGLVRFTHLERSEDTPRWQTEGAVNPQKINWLVRPYQPIANGWSSLANCVAHFNPSVQLDSASYSFYYPCTFQFHSICERNNTILDFLNRKFDFQD